MFNLICKWCWKEFTSKHSTQKFCCRRCAYGNKPVKYKDKQCLVCWKEFHPETETQKYCSHKCLWLAQRNRENSVCPICWKEFYSRNNKNQKYCSKECYTKSQIVVKDKQCLVCWKIFKPRGDNSKYCSRGCMAIWFSTPKWIKKIYIVECQQCWKEFETDKKDRKYCSNKCSTESHRIEDNICPVCWCKYHRAQPNQIYCWAECYWLALSDKWKWLSDEEKKKKISSFINSKREKESKTNKKYKEYLVSLWFDNISTEFYIGWKYYDLKVWDTLIEINPTYTHNSTEWPIFKWVKWEPKEKKYHYEKMETARDNWYRCIMIWDWDDKTKIPYLLDDKKEIIYARNCELRIINYDDCHQFFEDYHLQWDTKKNKNNIYIWLYYNNELVECISFWKPRYNKNYEWEILRLCSHKDYKIVGWANRIFKKFLEETNAGSVVSYCDMSKFDWGVYKKLWFNLLRCSKWTKHWARDRWPKNQRHLRWRFIVDVWVDNTLNTSFWKWTNNDELMRQAGYVEIYDCGQATFVWARE